MLTCYFKGSRGRFYKSWVQGVKHKNAPNLDLGENAISWSQIANAWYLALFKNWTWIFWHSNVSPIWGFSIRNLLLPMSLWPQGCWIWLYFESVCFLSVLQTFKDGNKQKNPSLTWRVGCSKKLEFRVHYTRNIFPD
jgi:hypothetical protein